MEKSGGIAVKQVWRCNCYHLHFMDMVNIILHVADEMRFNEPLPSGWEHSSRYQALFSPPTRELGTSSRLCNSMTNQVQAFA
jgi:hypothetical protein